MYNDKMHGPSANRDRGPKHLHLINSVLKDITKKDNTYRQVAANDSISTGRFDLRKLNKWRKF